MAITVTYDEIRRNSFRRRFQELFPEYGPLFNKFVNSPSCGACEKDLITALAKHEDRLRAFFGDDAVFDVDLHLDAVSDERFFVINCAIDDLAEKLNALPAGPKQVTAARYDDQITVIVLQSQ